MNTASPSSNSPPDASLWSLDALLPQRPPMRLLTAVIGPRGDTFLARVQLDATSLWMNTVGQVPVWIGLEYMAQTMAAASAWEAGEAAAAGSIAGAAPPAPRLGLLVGCRRCHCAVDAFRLGDTLEVAAVCTYSDGTTANYQCEIRDATTQAVCMSATLTAWQPPDPEAFVADTARPVARTTDATPTHSLTAGTPHAD